MTDADESSESLGPRTQWALVGLLAVCFLGFPLLMLAWPPTFLPYHDAFLALAMVPGLVLGVTAVWLTVKTGR